MNNISSTSTINFNPAIEAAISLGDSVINSANQTYAAIKNHPKRFLSAVALTAVLITGYAIQNIQGNQGNQGNQNGTNHQQPNCLFQASSHKSAPCLSNSSTANQSNVTSTVFDEVLHNLTNQSEDPKKLTSLSTQVLVDSTAHNYEIQIGPQIGDSKSLEKEMEVPATWVESLVIGARSLVNGLVSPTVTNDIDTRQPTCLFQSSRWDDSARCLSRSSTDDQSTVANALLEEILHNEDPKKLTSLSTQFSADETFTSPSPLIKKLMSLNALTLAANTAQNYALQSLENSDLKGEIAHPETEESSNTQFDMGPLTNCLSKTSIHGFGFTERELDLKLKIDPTLPNCALPDLICNQQTWAWGAIQLEMDLSPESIYKKLPPHFHSVFDRGVNGLYGNENNLIRIKSIMWACPGQLTDPEKLAINMPIPADSNSLNPQITQTSLQHEAIDTNPDANG